MQHPPSPGCSACFVYTVKLHLFCHTVAIKWAREKHSRVWISVSQGSLTSGSTKSPSSLVNSSPLLSNLSFDTFFPLIEARTHLTLCKYLYYPPLSFFPLSLSGSFHGLVESASQVRSAIFSPRLWTFPGASGCSLSQTLEQSCPHFFFQT